MCCGRTFGIGWGLRTERMGDRLKREKSGEFENFDSIMGDLLSVPHSEIKAKLEAEKREKATKKSPKPLDNPKPGRKI